MSEDTKQCLIIMSSIVFIICILVVSITYYETSTATAAMENGYSQTTLPGQSGVVWTKDK